MNLNSYKKVYWTNGLWKHSTCHRKTDGCSVHSHNPAGVTVTVVSTNVHIESLLTLLCGVMSVGGTLGYNIVTPTSCFFMSQWCYHWGTRIFLKIFTYKAGDTRALNVRARNARQFQRTLGISSDERCLTCVWLFSRCTSCRLFGQFTLYCELLRKWIVQEGVGAPN
jgi:hypothetical protein